MADVYALAAEWIRVLVPMEDMTDAHRATANAYSAALAERLGVDAAWVRTRNTRYRGEPLTHVPPSSLSLPISLHLLLLHPDETDVSYACKCGAREVTLEPNGVISVAENIVHKSGKRFMSLEKRDADGNWADAAVASVDQLLTTIESHYDTLRDNGMHVPLATYLP